MTRCSEMVSLPSSPLSSTLTCSRIRHLGISSRSAPFSLLELLPRGAELVDHDVAHVFQVAQALFQDGVHGYVVWDSSVSYGSTLPIPAGLSRRDVYKVDVDF